MLTDLPWLLPPFIPSVGFGLRQHGLSIEDRIGGSAVSYVPPPAPGARCEWRPWTPDFLNIKLNNHDLETAKERIRNYMGTFRKDGTRITGNVDFDAVRGPRSAAMAVSHLDGGTSELV